MQSYILLSCFIGIVKKALSCLPIGKILVEKCLKEFVVALLKPSISNNLFLIILSLFIYAIPC
jgi:hypothetical protein